VEPAADQKYSILGEQLQAPSSAVSSWTPEAIVNFIRDPGVWQALLTGDDCKVTQWHRRVEELTREPYRTGKRKKKAGRKDKRDWEAIVVHMHFFQDPAHEPQKAGYALVSVWWA
jgi:hypothetical protein